MIVNGPKQKVLRGMLSRRLSRCDRVGCHKGNLCDQCNSAIDDFLRAVAPADGLQQILALASGLRGALPKSDELMSQLLGAIEVNAADALEELQSRSRKARFPL